MDVPNRFRDVYYEYRPTSIVILERPAVAAALVFVSLTVLFAFPIVLRPGRLYLTAPGGRYLVEGANHFYVLPEGLRLYVDHVGHLNAAERAAEQWQNGGPPVVMRPSYTVPPSYLLTGALVISLLPVETVVFYNGFFLASMFLAGFFTFLLTRKVTGDPNVALLSGVLYMSSFFLFSEYLMGHTNQWQLQWIPLIFYGVERVRDPDDGQNIVLLGVAFILQLLSSTQYSVYLTFLLPLYIAFRYVGGADEFGSRRFWARFTAAGLLALLLAAPYLWARFSLVGETPTYSLEKNAYEAYVLNDTFGAFHVSDILPQLGFRLALLFAGGIVILVAAGRRRQKRMVPFLGLLVVGVVLARGPFEPWAPYALLHQYWPLIEFYRVPYRTLPFGLLGASVLSAGVLSPFTSEPGGKWSRRALIVVAGIVAVQVVLVYSLLRFTPYPV